MDKIKLILGESPWGLQLVVLKLMITPVGSSLVPNQPKSSHLHIGQHLESYRHFRDSVQEIRGDLRRRRYESEISVRNPDTDLLALSQKLTE